MHLITAIIKPHRLADLKNALQKAGINGMTITEVKGFGRQKGHTETYRGTEYEVSFVPKIRIEILASAELKDTAITTISQTTKTGTIGDGKIWVTPVEQVIRIRTGEMDSDAI